MKNKLLVISNMCVCVCVTEMLISKEMEYQDFRGVKLRGLEEKCKKAAQITLVNYNQALVQYKACSHTDGHKHTHTHRRLMWMFSEIHRVLSSV